MTETDPGLIIITYRSQRAGGKQSLKCSRNLLKDIVFLR